MNPATSADTILLLAPEVVLVVTALVVFLGGAFAGLRSGWLVAVGGIAIAFVIESLRTKTTGTSGPLAIDPFSEFARWLVLLLGGLVALVQSGDTATAAFDRDGSPDSGTAEEAGTFLLLLAGLSVAAVAHDLALLFVGLELVSIPTVILLALKRVDAQGQEASLKYFFLSLVASSLFLYGVVCLYGIGGSTDLATIGARLRSTAPGTVVLGVALVPLATGLVLAGAAFRLAAVPLHFYAPDVYQGTSPGNAALLSTLPKLAGVIVLLRLAGLAMPPLGGSAGYAAVATLDLLWPAAALLAAASMTIGNVMALGQTNLRRLLACSSIAHGGYLLVGIAAAAASGAARGRGDAASAAMTVGGGATLFYVATYSIATLGVFGALTAVGHRWPVWTAADPRPDREEVSTVSDLDGLSSTNPVIALAIAVCLLSLAGIPPLPGFWGKLSLVTAALEVDAGGWSPRRLAMVALAVTLVINAAIAAAYYLRIIAAMYFRGTERGVQADGGLGAGLGMLAALMLVGVFTVYPQGLFRAARRAGVAALGEAGTAPSAIAPLSGTDATPEPAAPAP